MRVVASHIQSAMKLTLTPAAYLLGVLVATSLQDRLDGGCVQNGVRVAEGDLVPQPEPCHVCHCRRGQVSCFWKSCAAPPDQCEVMELEDRCNPSLYVCPIPESVVEVPLQAAASLLTPARTAGDRPPPAAAATRSRQRSRTPASTAARTAALSAPVAAATASTATKRRRGRLPAPAPAAVESPAAEAAAAPAPVLLPRPAPPPARSQTRHRPGAAADDEPPSPNALPPPGAMKIVLQPRVRPQFGVGDGGVVALPELRQVVEGLSRAAGTYFDEQLSVPENFVMPSDREAAEVPTAPVPGRRQGRRLPLVAAATGRNNRVSRVSAAATRQNSRVSAPAAYVTGRNNRVSAGSGTVTEQKSRVSTASPLSAAAPVPAARGSAPAAAGRSRARSSRRRGHSRGGVKPTGNTGPAEIRQTTRKPPSRSRSPSPPTHTAATTKPAGHRTAATTVEHARQIDLQQVDLASAMFPEFGRRLRRDLSAAAEPFDAAAVRRLERVWSHRRSRSRRSLLLDGRTDNHVQPRGDKSCTILGVQYQLGEVIGVASDHCLECRCAAQALFCSPKCCFFPLEARPLLEARRRLQSRASDRRPHPLQPLLGRS